MVVVVGMVLRRHNIFRGHKAASSIKAYSLSSRSIHNKAQCSVSCSTPANAAGVPKHAAHKNALFLVATTSRRLVHVALSTFHVAPSCGCTLREACRASFLAAHDICKAADNGLTFTNHACGSGISVNCACNDMGVERNRTDIAMPLSAIFIQVAYQQILPFHEKCMPSTFRHLAINSPLTPT